MKVTPKKFYEVEAQLIHCGPADGNDLTLCGFTLDGDQGEILEWESGRIDCPQCLAVIHFCRSIIGRSISSTQGRPPMKVERYVVQSSLVRGERRAYWIEPRPVSFSGQPPVIEECGTNKRKAHKRCDELNAALISPADRGGHDKEA